VLSPEDVGRIADLARHYRVPVLSDEIYRRFLYEGEFASIASLPGMKPQTVILDGFSKSYAMTGWRLGFGVMPKPLAEHLTRLMTNSVSCTATFIQHAGLAALRGDDTPVQAMVEEFRQRRDLIVDGLNRIPGVSCKRPRGAFYVFPNVKSFGRPSKQIATHLLEQAGVAVLGGTAFGEFGEGYLRLSYAASRDTIQEALRRIASGLASLP
jgi:aspartate aminotransferase